MLGEPPQKDLWLDPAPSQISEFRRSGRGKIRPNGDAGGPVRPR